MRCERVRDILPAAADDAKVVPTRLARAHVSRCLRCQAELAQYRRLRRTARSLAAEGVVPPPDLLDTILASLDGVVERTGQRSRRALAYIGGAAAATATAAAGAFVLTRRLRRA